MIRGIRVTHQENSKSYHNGNEQRVTRIEVESELFDFDSCYQDVTLDTEYSEWQQNELKNMLNG